MKRSYCHHHRHKLPICHLKRYYLGLLGDQNMYSGLLLQEFDHIISKKHILPLEKYILIEPIRSTIMIYLKIKQEQEN